MQTPRIVGYLFGFAFLYGVYAFRPAWITGALGLLILYAVLTNVDRFASLTTTTDGKLRGLIAPRTK